MVDLKHFEAVKGIIFYQNRVLVVQAEKYEGGLYEVPGGRKKDTKESDEEALRREVLEEVGLEIRVKRLLNKWSVNLPKMGLHIDGKTYLCESSSNVVKLSGEHIDYKWLSLEELSGINIPGWLREAISNL
ncbi:NUDIX domain-containing protein [Candidatus Woesearchaeota archaeon]|nr:NUDIX domain-containing protein [Candidatus Woesearchaeota archaeon]